MLITRDDIQRIGDEDTLMHFLEEKLNLPIPEGLELEDITMKFSNFALGLSGVIADHVLDCQELSLSLGKPSGIFLIRFNSEQDYPGVLRAVAESLIQWNRNLMDLRFICADEYFQPFALAHFNDPELEDWQSTPLNILTWSKDNTRIHKGPEHELPVSFFFGESSSEPDSFYEDDTEAARENDFNEEDVTPDEPEDNQGALLSENQSRTSPEVTIKQPSPAGLLAKLQNTGAPLSRYGNIYSGILTGYNKAFVIDESKRQQLIDENTTSSELIKSVLTPSEKWQSGLAYLIWIPSSENKYWPWSEARNETEARWIFEDVYPAISRHLKRYEDNLKSRNHKGKFYWEFTASNLYSIRKQSKIAYPRNGASMRATYETSEALPLFPGNFIPTEDLSLLAILNSTLFDWYIQIYRNFEPNSRSEFKHAFMKNVPIATRTEEQKEELSQLVQQILAAPDNFAVSDLEKRIDMLVYELYELTDAEIALIIEYERLSPKPQDRTTSSATLTSTQQAAPVRRQTQTEVNRLLEMLQNTESQLAISPPNAIVDAKNQKWSATTVSPDALLTKLQNVGSPLGQNWSIYTGITPGRVQAFVIDKFTGMQMISADARNSDLIKPLTRVPKVNRWIPEPAYLICISSSRHKRWPWSNTEDEFVAERIFAETYPIISSHLTNYKDILKSRTDGSRGKFYWELSTREPKREIYPEFYQSKIIYPLNSSSMRALYDPSESFILGSSYCIPTKDLSLLAILNSTLFNWYAQFKCKAPRGGNSLLFSKENMVNISIAPRTTEQKVNLSHLVQQILDAPNSSAVPVLEEEINMLVYDLYELTAVEIALIEEESN